MNIPALIRMGVKLAENAAGSVRAEVTHIPVIGSNRYGPAYGTPVKRLAIVEDVSEPVVGSDGTERVSMSKLTFLEPIKVEDRDKFRLPDGTEGNVVKRGGLIDPSHGEPYLTEVWLGR